MSRWLSLILTVLVAVVAVPALRAFGTALPNERISAAVPYPDGGYRLLYSVESPESWFEDFGHGQLVNGQATVTIAQDFLPAVDTSRGYYVFLTPHGDSNGLYVSNQGSTSFEVREQKGGTSSLSFDYRLVARRKDVAAPRLQPVTVPAAPARPAAPAPPPPIPPLPTPQIEPLQQAPVPVERR
jgi:hypothetical protein